jgi:hypothetical protein
MQSHAAATLRYIRHSMEAATGFAVPGTAGIAMGSIGVLAMGLVLWTSLAPHWLTVWLVAALVAAAAGGVLVIRPASVSSLLRPGTPVRRLALCLAPSILAGAILTAVLSSHSLLTAIPGTWLLLYGSALISASVATRPLVAVMGLCFMALGLIAFVLPLQAQMGIMGAGFGGLHLAFGGRLLWEAHGRES